jgi:hypothetical protein
MNRYHRSFIGLMEQSNTGEWVKHEDIIHEQQITKQIIQSCKNESFTERRINEKLSDEISQLKLDKKILHLLYWWIIAIILLEFTFGKVAKAVTPQEEICIAQSIYFEGRSESKTTWENMYQVAINRSKHPKQFKAKSSNLCDVVHSKHYKTYKLRTVKNLKKYKEILTVVKHYSPKTKSKILYFASSSGKTKFRTSFKG